MASHRQTEVLKLSKILCLTGSGTCTRWGISCIRQSGKISSNKSILRAISRTTSHNLLRVPRTTSNPKSLDRLGLFSKDQKSEVDNENYRKTNEASNKSWVKRNPKGNGVKPPAGLEYLLNSWVMPETSTVFPFSQHHNRNSSTTPKENKFLAESTNTLLKKAVQNTTYSTTVNWDFLMQKVEKVSSKDVKINMDVTKPKLSRQLLSLSPSSGRGVFVTEKTNLIKAFRQVETSCNRNRVRRDANGQRFHERPGLKRKRLKSQRWRERFRDGFKATLERVQELRSQGW
ncbi:Ribosomal protein S21 domain-containing protein [Golovinomyces cichoracearum]|uniref:Ribosomal protein S21 domain-containing protein n=1 Tax=Golovinomyces cichoracearum TaxID=62708 RepID=A0A420HKF6_9PEZI|nr:Ribosomal protein S21 domain-containing protein [Golovinomyces cichoracearum]